MSKKYTYEYVKSKFEERGYTLLETEYVNNRTKMKYICDNGHENYMRFNSFKKGNRCPNCVYIKTAERCRLSFDFIKNEFEKRNFILLEDKYINSRTKMKYKCDKGHENYTTYGNFSNNRKCPDCSNLKKHTFKFVKNEFEKIGYNLLETEYINANTKMKYICDKGHKNEIRFNNLRRGNRCRKCWYNNSNTGKNSHFWNPNREQVKLNKLLQKRSRNILQRTLKYINQNKTDRTYKLLGFTTNQLKNKFISFKKWNIIKEQNWHIDHIIPIKAFVEYGVDDLKIINHLTNLQPLDKETNIQKSDKYRKKDLHKYMQNFPEWNYDKNKGIYIKLCQNK